VLNATLPRIIQRRILRMLPPELGRYLLDGGTGVSTHGEIGAPHCQREQCCVSAAPPHYILYKALRLDKERS
jgi:hypothetical protein